MQILVRIPNRKTIEYKGPKVRVGLTCLRKSKDGEKIVGCKGREVTEGLDNTETLRPFV